ncbi:hypothetical protein [Candidatus Vallotia cooleyia]|uniref:hypothetical protein n=1 Tax=Candidatus Vallotiella adelgis TaxID=1177211 RepID=UPI001D022899|nr:hypothetical protein [Candidatus Vallotia cooleyia]
MAQPGIARLSSNPPYAALIWVTIYCGGSINLYHYRGEDGTAQRAQSIELVGMHNTRIVATTLGMLDDDDAFFSYLW